MKLDKLKRLAWKEFTRSPAKTATLLALLPVAIYFCLPLFKGLLPTTSKTSAESTDTENMAFVIPTDTSDEPVVVQQAASWEQVSEWIAKDSYTVAASLPETIRDPFASVLPEVQGEPAKIADDEIQTPDVKPLPAINDLQLALSATIVGPSVRVATINGKDFRQGQTIQFAVQSAEGEALGTLDVLLATVKRRSVILRHGGEMLELRIQDDIPADAITVQSISR